MVRGSAAACPGGAAYGGLAGAPKTQAESKIKGREVFGWKAGIWLCYPCWVTSAAAFLRQVGNLTKSVLTVRQTTNAGWSLILSASFWTSLRSDFNLLYEILHRTHMFKHPTITNTHVIPSYPPCCTLHLLPLLLKVLFFHGRYCYPHLAGPLHQVLSWFLSAS